MSDPLSLARPLSVDERFAYLERIVLEQGQRIATLEARPQRQEAPRQPEPLRQHNASKRTEADRLKAEIAKLLDGHPLAHELTGRQIREALKCAGYTPLPAERTVRLHLAQIRGIGNTGGIAG